MTPLGSFVTDKITGFSGTVTGVCLYLTGCNQALVQPKAVDAGKMPESAWIDTSRLTVDPSVAAVSLDHEDNPGFDREPPRR